MPFYSVSSVVSVLGVIFLVSLLVSLLGVISSHVHVFSVSFLRSFVRVFGRVVDLLIFVFWQIVFSIEFD